MSEFIQIPMYCSLEDAEQIIVNATLKAFDGHKVNTAKSLGISRPGLDGKLRRWARWWTKGKRTPQVYCIRDDHRDRVKIGWSSSPVDRLEALTCASGVDLRLVHTVACKSISAAMRMEAFLHEEFAAHWLISEWFDDADEVVSRLLMERASQLPEVAA